MGKFRIFCDGSSSTSFGSAYSVVLKGGGVKRGIMNISKTFEKVYTVLEIEYLALLGAMEHLLNLPNHKVVILSDSIQILNIIHKKYNPPSFIDLEKFNKLDNELKIQGKKVTYQWTPRKENLAGIYLEKRLFKLKHYMANKR